MLKNSNNFMVISCYFLGERIQVRSATKMNPGEGWLRMRGHHGHFNRKSKLPNVKAPHPLRAISNLQPYECESDAHADCPIFGQELHHDEPLSQPRACPPGYRDEQAYVKASEPAQGSRKARCIPSWVWPKVAFYLGLQWSPANSARTATQS